MITSKIKPE